MNFNYLKNHNLSLILLTAFTFIGGAACFGTQDVEVNRLADGSHVADPFPKVLLDHTSFKVFRGRNFLGYTFRDEGAQVFGPRYWIGKETRPSGKGDERIIEFSQKQSAALGARIPALGFKAGSEKSYKIKVKLVGLKVYQLTVPVLGSEYRDSVEARKSPFMVSMLRADQVVIQVELASDKGVQVGSEEDLVNIVSGKLKYSQRHKGMVAAENAFIGYRMAAPTAQDINRRAVYKKEIRKLAIFDLEDKTSSDDDNFLSFTMRHKLEEAFQSIADFEVLTDRKEDAKYHLKGSFRKIGKDRIYFNLALKNTYNQGRVVGKPLTKAIKIQNIDELYDLQVLIVEEFARPFGLKIKGDVKKRVINSVKQTSDIELLKLYRKASGFYGQGKYVEARALLNQILAKDPLYLDALSLQGYALLRLSKFDESYDKFNLMMSLSRKKKDPVWESKSLFALGEIMLVRTNYKKALNYHQKSLDIRKAKYGEEHPLTSYSYGKVGWTRYLLSYKLKGSARKSGFKLAETNLKKARNILVARYGPDNTRLINVNSSLAYLFMSGRQYPKSLEFLSANVRICEKFYGASHITTAGSYQILGQLYGIMGQNQKAVLYLAKALKTYKRVYRGEYHKSVGFSYIEIGNVYVYKKDFKSAQIFMERGARIYERLYKPGNSNINYVYGRLGFIFYKLNNFPKAEAFWKKSGDYARFKHLLVVKKPKNEERPGGGAAVPGNKKADSGKNPDGDGVDSEQKRQERTKPNRVKKGKGFWDN